MHRAGKLLVSPPPPQAPQQHLYVHIDLHSAYIQTMHAYIDTYVQTDINTCTSTYIHAYKHHDIVACIHTCVHSSFALTRARAKLLYNSSNFQYFVAAMIILGFLQDVVDAQILPVEVLFLVAYVRLWDFRKEWVQQRFCCFRFKFSPPPCPSATSTWVARDTKCSWLFKKWPRVTGGCKN